MRSSPLPTFLLALTLALFASCERYVAPPAATIEGLDNGLLQDPAAPIVVDFSKPVDPATLTLEVIKFTPNADGKLPDEVGDPNATLDALFSHDPVAGDSGGTGALDASATRFTITPRARLPVGPKLAVLIEPGLADTAHDGTSVTGTRKRLLFAYSFKCTGTGATRLAPGPYFFLLNVDQPIGTQVRLFASLDIDAKTGRFSGQFTRANRIADASRCSPSCADGNVCRTLPGPAACVVPSTRAGSSAEFPDFEPDPTPPVGFSFGVGGCAEDQADGSVAFATQPANMVLEQPPVSVDGLVLLASFAKEASGAFTATGAITGDDVVLGTSHLGAGHGTVEAQAIPPEQAPPSIPPPPPAGTSP